MKLNKYFVYLDDGNDVLKIAVPAESESEAEKFCEGNGEIVKIKEITSEVQIAADAVAYALKKGQNFSETEIDLIIRTLTSTGMAE